MSTVQIKIAGTDRTSAILFATAYFQSQVNGVPGEAHFRIRDPTRTLTILSGALVELIIDSEPVWTGFVSAPKRVYVFPSINIDDFGETRFIDVDCVDLNVLFQRRIVFDQVDPENILAPLYGPNTADTVAIADLVADWLDLSGDGIDTSTFVTGVGDINEDQDARAWSGSDTWGNAMGSIALLPAAIYYLSPSKDLVYCDTDTPTAPFGLSDQPNGTTFRRYSDMEILLDGSNLANDVMCWGIGYGSNVPVFVRDEDATSQAAHGLWQLGQVTFGIYKQATINRVADSILNGSPDNRRGAKDDRPAVTVTTYEPGLLPSQKVDFRSEVFGWDDVLPIRKMEVTFEAPDAPKYVLTLSHEIDTPWSFFDPWRFNLPRLPQLPPFPPWPPLPEPEDPGGCAGCGVTDAFTRTTSEVVHSSNAGTTHADMGLSDAAVFYRNAIDGDNFWLLSNGGVGLSTDGAMLKARLFCTAGSLDFGSASAYLATTVPTDYGAIKSMTFSLDGLPSDGSNPAVLTIGFGFGAPSGTKSARVFLNPGSAAGFFQSYLGFTATTADAQLIPDAYWQIGTTYTVTLQDTGSGTTITITDGTTLYSHTSTGYTGPTIQNPSVSVASAMTSVVSTQEFTVSIDNINIPEITRCNYRFDDFQRVDAADWGLVYDITSDPNAVLSVEPGVGVILMNASAGSAQAVLEATATSGQWWNNASYDMVTAFQTSEVANTNLRFLFYEGTFATYRLVDLLMDSDTISVENAAGSDSAAYSGWSDSTPMYLKFQVEGGFIRVKVWDTDQAEPGSWNVELADADATTVPNMRVEANSAGVSSDFEIKVFYIDFDYDGKPCYEECATGGGPLVDEDTFARTISAGSTDLGTSEFDGNPPWVADGTLRPNLSATGGIVTMTAAASPNNRNIQDVVDIDMRLPIDIVFRGRLTPASASGSIVINMEQPPLDGSNYVTIQMATHPTLAAARLVTVGAGDGVTDYSATSNANVILPNVWYTVRATFRRDSVRAKWWADGDPEPDSWTIQVGITGDIIDALDLNNTLELRMTETSELDGIAFYETGCAPVPPEPASLGGPMYGPRCDLAVRIDSTHYQLAMSVSPGTTNVTVGTPGYLYLPGIARDYTCSDEDGILTFADPITDGTRVYVCYTAAGPL